MRTGNRYVILPIFGLCVNFSSFFILCCLSYRLTSVDTDTRKHSHTYTENHLMNGIWWNKSNFCCYYNIFTCMRRVACIHYTCTYVSVCRSTLMLVIKCVAFWGGALREKCLPVLQRTTTININTRRARHGSIYMIYLLPFFVLDSLPRSFFFLLLSILFNKCIQHGID